MTALTDSDEEDVSDTDDEQPADTLSILLQRVDSLRQGTESDKRESLDILLEQREEVCHIYCILQTLHTHPL